jgi:hypothetical protein
VEDMLRQLDRVEAGVSELKSRMSGILATAPHLATKADILNLRTAIVELKGEMFARLGPPKADMWRLRLRLFKWAVGLNLVVAVLSLVAAKLWH